MRTFENDNYYQILQVATTAGTDEIKRAYRDALALYEKESIVTYSLFSEEQRDILLQAIEVAFATLVNENKRAAYNQMLIDTGQVDATIFSKQAQRQLAVYSDVSSTSREKSLSQWVRKKTDEIEIKQLIEEIHSKEMLSGKELMQLREALGIEIPEIYAITKISNDTLKMIEANQFKDLPATIYLKQFLKAYANILQLDSQHVVEGYLKYMDADQRDP